MNAAVLAEGYLQVGRDGARKSLAAFWHSISDAGAFAPIERKLLDTFFALPLAAMSMRFWTDFVTHFASPYDINPLNINLLRDYPANTADFAKVRALTKLKLFVEWPIDEIADAISFDRRRCQTPSSSLK
ncbi:MAG: hypothetical protein L0Y60_10225 [Beijerinckiaceae bacterium]|nr:hypothetical protein [Beijerinckiaceae bacterium]